MKALRLYYDQQGIIIYTIGLEGPGKFPKTVKKELAELPANTQMLKLTDGQTIIDYLKSEGSSVEAGKLILGKEIEKPPLPPQRDVYAELDALKAAVIALEAK